MILSSNLITRLLIQDRYFMNGGRKSVHIVAQFCDSRTQGRAGARLHGIVFFPVKHLVLGAPALELTAPDAPEIEIGLPIIIDETTRVDAVTSRKGEFIWGEWAFGVIPHGDTDAENTFFVSSGEVEVVFSIFGAGVRGPELFGDPGDGRGGEDDAVVGYGAGDGRHREDVVVLHGVLVSIVVVLDVSGDVM
ncbi:hypothetical protein DID88_004610 [Monilinia fructigena]|uniref:Uncharacterized protein n=1 Tax=Monilinia fructigena TaxID=38457 RepID=A0A395IT05_9HELO|nr:hypothetical protein DID88_004610 [Monilinia fructigena]